MPKIQQYDSQIEAAQPVGALSPNIELAGAPGRAAENLGNKIGEVGDLIQRRGEQEKSADAYSNFAALSAASTNEIKASGPDGDGTLNPEKIQKKYADLVDQAASDYEGYPIAQDYFKRQAARLSKNISLQSSTAYAKLAGQKETVAFDQGFTDTQAAILGDPHSFIDGVKSFTDAIHTKVATGQIPQQNAETYVRQGAAELAKSAVQGWARQDPGMAYKMLNSGAFDKALSPDELKAQLGVVEQYQRAADVQKKVSSANEDDAQAAQLSAWKTQALTKATRGQLDPREIIENKLLDDDQKKTWINFAEAQADRQQSTKGSTYTSLYRRIHLPDNDPQKISDASQIVPYVGKGISAQAAGELESAMKKTPEGERLLAARKRTLDQASKIINAKTMTGQPDVDGPENLARFVKDMGHAEDEARKNGTPVMDVFDPENPKSMIKKIPQYKSTLQRQIEQQTHQTLSAVGAAPAPQAPATIANVPGQQIAQPKQDETKIKPGESPAEFLKRRGL